SDRGAAKSAAVPSGYRLIKDSGLKGGVLISDRSPDTAPGPALQAAFDEVSDFFGGRPQAGEGFADDKGDQNYLFFESSTGDSTRQGIAFAVRMSNKTRLGFAFAPPEQFRTAWPGLLKKAFPDETGGETKRAELPAMQWAEYPDRSGKIKLPSDWQILESQQGSVLAKGPQGTAALGWNVQVFTDTWIRQFYPATICAPYTDPVTAYVNVMPQYLTAAYFQNQTPPEYKIRIVESAPVQAISGGQSAIIHAVWDMTVNGQPQPTGEEIALVIIAPTASDKWLYYYSLVSCPSAGFRENLPTLMAIWQSNTVSNRVFERRIADAMKNLREANQIVQDVLTNRQEAMDRSFADWDEYVRGTRPIKDETTGEVRDAPLYEAEDMVNWLNEKSGYKRYTSIRARDLK
ncbi:MAG: hypothetical protein PHI34_14435, partial [Acidobacteriota bacterium]|nr:hypothetical protein [Acidobacteriota bacterium]